jgi:hypothetical protein
MLKVFFSEIETFDHLNIENIHLLSHSSQFDRSMRLPIYYFKFRTPNNHCAATAQWGQMGNANIALLQGTMEAIYLDRNRISRSANTLIKQHCAR